MHFFCKMCDSILRFVYICVVVLVVALPIYSSCLKYTFLIRVMVITLHQHPICGVFIERILQRYICIYISHRQKELFFIIYRE